MALFKPMIGNRANLDTLEKHAGYAYFCTDDGTFHIDYVDANGTLQRKQINAKEAEALIGCDITPEKIAAWDAAVEHMQSSIKELPTVSCEMRTLFDELETIINDMVLDMPMHSIAQVSICTDNIPALLTLSIGEGEGRPDVLATLEMYDGQIFHRHADSEGYGDDGIWDYNWQEWQEYTPIALSLDAIDEICV